MSWALENAEAAMLMLMRAASLCGFCGLGGIFDMALACRVRVMPLLNNLNCSSECCCHGVMALASRMRVYVALYPGIR